MNDLAADQWRQVEDLFAQAIALEGDARVALLRDSDAEAAVIREVESLLGFHHTARDKMDAPLVTPAAVMEAVDELAEAPLDGVAEPPETVGPYRIRRRIGEGGMGTVYLAEQERPLRRRVALKLIKPGMDTRSVLARFDAERQALALMSHAHVARAIDAGSTPDGRPYFVMEFVDGVRITDYCDAQRLDVTSRLMLFLKVCEGIQHAHQKGVIHRDIKPSNVLVADSNGQAHPIVIDFGVAKATDQRLSEETVFTQEGIMLGTPEYMSPEQAASNTDAVDTRSDIYSLGVLLYEMLVGALPLDRKTMQDASLSELQRMVREQEPPKPTTRLSSLGETAERSAHARRTDPASLKRLLRGDLEWIVMKSLAKEPERRYATVIEFGEDIRRFLRHEPVLAGPPRLSYRLAKFARRHRGYVAAGMIIVLLVVGGITSTISFALSAARQRALAEAQVESTLAVNRFLNAMLASVNPKMAKGRDVTVLREILDRAASRIDSQFADQPRVEASVRRTIGQAYLNLSRYEDAAPHLERAVALERSQEHPSLADLATVVFLLGRLRYEQGRWEEGERLLSEAIELRRQVGAAAEISLASDLNQLGMLLLDNGRFEEAKARLDEALRLLEDRYGVGAPETTSVLNTLAAYHANLGEHEAAVAALREVLDLQAHNTADADALVTMHNLAQELVELNEFEEAETLYLRALEGHERVFGPDHAATLSVRNSLANLMERQKKFDESERWHREILASRRRLFGDKHPAVHNSLHNLGNCLLAQGKVDECIEVTREAVATARDVHGERHPAVALSLGLLGFALRDTKDPANYAEAEQCMREAISIFDATLPKDHPFTQNTLRGLRRLYAEEAMNDPAKLAEIEARLTTDEAKASHQP